jgi:multiple antibiotic resistance protein
VQAVVFVAPPGALFVTLLLFLAAAQIAAVIGDAAMTLTSRVMGILLMALAAEFVVQGIRDSLLK